MEIFNSRLRTYHESAISLSEKLYVDGVLHCCNVFCNFNTDFGKKIAKLYPAAVEKDKETEKGDRTKLGTYTFIKKNKSSLSIKNIGFYVINGYTYKDQKNIEFDYEALEKILTDLNSVLNGKLIAFVIPQYANFNEVLKVMKKSVQLYSVLITKD